MKACKDSFLSRYAILWKQSMLIYQLCFSGFSLDPLDMGDVPPPPDKCTGDKVLIWRFMREGGHRHYGGGPKSDRLYHKLKVLLLLLQVMQLLLL